MLLSFIALESTVLYMITAVCVVVAYLVLYFLKCKRPQILFAALFLVILIPVTLSNIAISQRAQAYNGKTREITAVITTPETDYGVAHSYNARLEKIGNRKIKGTNIVFITFKDNLFPGDRITATAELESTKESPSFYADKVFLKASADEPDSVQKGRQTFRYKLFSLQQYVKETVLNYIQGDLGQLIIAVITGDRSDISDEAYGLIKASGVTHMIVVSGMHLSIVCATLIYVLRRVLPNQYIQNITMLAVVFFIMLFCGFSKSVLRAGITYIVISLSSFFRRDHDSLSALSLTVILVLLIDPFAAYSVSFQLTLSATYGILVLAPMLSGKVNNVLRTEKVYLLKEMVDAVSVTISANILTLPIVLYTYQWVSAVSLITNILISYAVSAMLVLGIVGTLTGKIKFIAYPCFFLAGLLSKYSLSVIEYFGALPFATIDFSGKALAVIVCLIYLVAYVYYTLIKSKKALV